MTGKVIGWADKPCLNPCFGGRWSRRVASLRKAGAKSVLILVLVEDGLGDYYFSNIRFYSGVS